MEVVHLKFNMVSLDV